MNILIAGAGRVGRELCRVLAPHNTVSIIDNDSERLQKVDEEFDALTVLGSASDPGAYGFLQQFDQLDVLLAVTNSDEVNICCGLIVDQMLEVQEKIIRANNAALGSEALGRRLGVDYFVSPEREAATAAIDLVRHLWARDLIRFQFPGVQAVAFDLDTEAHHGTRIIDLMRDFHGRVLVSAIERQNELIIPHGGTSLYRGDRVYFLGSSVDLEAFAHSLELALPRPPERCVVLGAGAIGIMVAHSLAATGASVKILDRDVQRCERAAAELGDDALVICDNHSTGGIFCQENLHLADLLISTTVDDEYNLIMGMSARQMGIGRVICLNSNSDYFDVAHRMDLDLSAGPKLAMVSGILNQLSHRNVVSESTFLGGRGTVIHWVVRSGSRLATRSIAEMGLPQQALAVAYRRGDSSGVVTGDFTPMPGDTIVLFCAHQVLAQVKKRIMR